MERNRKRKNGATKEYISIQSTVNVTVSSQAEKRVGYIDKFMSKADFTARNGKQVCIKEADLRPHDSTSWFGSDL